MTSVQTIQKEITRIREKTMFKPKTFVICRLWMPSDDPRHKMTDEEIIKKAHEESNRIICLPTRESE